jgi:hypothetical protein
MKDLMDIEAPIWIKPRTDNPDAKRAQPRRLKDEPKCEQPSIATADAIRVLVRTETELPTCKKLLTESALDKRAQLRKDNEAPTVTKPSMDTDEAIRAQDLREIDAATCE